MDQSVLETVQALIDQEALPPSYVSTVERTILPLAEHIAEQFQQKQAAVIVGVHGAQGTGKSTLTLFLKQLLDHHFNVRTASFSLDDIYLTKVEREHLAQSVHPLLLTRGVPGTHDVGLGERVLDQLLAASAGTRVPVPVFDKAIDDRLSEDQWPGFEGPADVVLVEGWCMGAVPVKDRRELSAPVNALELSEDPDAIWRHYVNDCLDDGYRAFFERMDTLIMLNAPSMECVLEWRTLQEHKLARRLGDAPKEGGSVQPLRIMTDDEVARFVMHYERITRRCLAEMPSRADIVIDVAEDHSLGLSKRE
ncbi:hypothetical protein [Marinobacter sp.]|uniref:hypothetical protein n=1 Tax=Marinobacter sp. TaxID=50741 RepID=UPI0034A4D9AC